MGIFSKIRNAFTVASEIEKEYEKIILNAYQEYKKKSGQQFFWSPVVTETTIWAENIKNWPDKKKIDFFLYLIPTIHHYASKNNSWSSDDPEVVLHNTRSAFVQAIIKHKLIMDEEDATKIFDAFTEYRYSSYAPLTLWPVYNFLSQLEKLVEGRPLSLSMKTLFQRMKNVLGDPEIERDDKVRLKTIERIDNIFFKNESSPDAIKPVRFLGEDPFADFANPTIETMQTDERNHWYRLLAIVQKASGSKPSSKYLKDTKAIIDLIGTEKYKRTLYAWFQFLISLKERTEQHTAGAGNYLYTYTSSDYITTINADAVKGFIWTCAHFHDQLTIQTIVALAERAFKKIPNKGPTSASIGNSCLYVLYKSKGLDGVGQLSRLKLRIKQSSTQALINKYLEAAAKEQGVTIGQIEDMAVDDGGLSNGKRVFEFDDYKCELVVTGIGKTEQNWYKPDGSLQKAVPAFVKEKHAAKFKKLKDTAKKIEQTLTAQRDRIDRMFRVERRIAFVDFKKYYIDHGLMSYLTHRIIWNFHIGNQKTAAIYLENTWTTVDGNLVDIGNTSDVSLWHPVFASLVEIKEWRNFFIKNQIQQPLKQAYREVYLLTDAEVNTSTYSNRMAAHILRQHQFNSLAKTRGWKYLLMGGFDNGDNGRASLELPEWNLRAEFWINEIAVDTAMSDSGIWSYVSTDQVRFHDINSNELKQLVDVPALIFSEVMRDVDLFVGVASVGNDPVWRDNGGLPVYNDYWQHYSFGDLGEVAKNRKEIISGLLPRLIIKDIAEIKDKFLVVKGKLRTYKIHFGSTNILMEPNDQYLCIVPDRSEKSAGQPLFLPFEGDTGLSIILSKAFLLAEDDKIKDRTILSQINRE